MPRRLLSIGICLTLAWLSGCAHCRARHAARACCRSCEPCGCAPMGSAEYVDAEYVEFQPAPGVTMPGPIYRGFPGPLGGIPGPTVSAIPGPRGR